MGSSIVYVIVVAIVYCIGHYHGFCAGIKDEQELNNRKINQNATERTDNKS